MNAAQKSPEARSVSASEPSHPADVDIPLVSDPVSVTVVGSAQSHSSHSHLSSTLLLLATESIEVGASPNRLEESFDSDEFFLLADSVEPHSARQADAERLRRTFQQNLSHGGARLLCL